MTLKAAVLAAAALALPGFAGAQAYPSKPIHMVNQFQAGASGDISSRAVSDTLSRMIGQPVVVENKPGGAGLVAAAYVAKSEPDGYTLLNATSGITTLHLFSKNVSIDPLTALTPVTQIGSPVVVFVVNAGFPARSMRELLEYAKANPNKVTFGTSGIGSPHHLSGEEIQELAGVKMRHVPYKASAQALLDTVAGQIVSTFAIYSVTKPQIAAGKVRVLAQVREERYKLLPDVPTMADQVPGFDEPPSWTGIFAPAKIPQDILTRINGDLVKALNDPELIKKMEATDLTVHPQTPQQFAEVVKKGVALTAKLAQIAGIKPR